jgi:nucleotide-binding universal stress UspA family protein
MPKLLVAFDGSDDALRALEHAVSLARAGSGSLHVVYAHEEPRVFGEIAVYATAEKMAELQRQEGEALLERAKAALQAAGVPHTTEVLTGPVAPTIAKRADELGCDGIVMGTRGRGALGSLIMGSVATKILHYANVPVTLVK